MPSEPRIASSDCSLPAPDIRIQVRMPEPWTHYFVVQIAVAGLTGEQARLKMPVWTPGSYMVREFSRNVHEFSASGGSGAGLAWEKLDKCTWLVHTRGENRWSVEYRVYAFELSVRTCFLNDSHAYINGAGLFMLLEGFENCAYQLQLEPYAGWSGISTGLEPVAGETCRYIAPDFDTLIDCPIEVGNQEILQFEIQKRPHRIAIYGRGEFNRERLARDFQKIVEACAEMMGDLPYPHFTFLLHLLSEGRSGLEHANSMSIQTSRWFSLSRENYDRFLDLVAHEFFHVWNIKRIRPIELGPFDYGRENYSRMLWVSEGFTDYYSGRILRRAGLIDSSSYLADISKSIRELQEMPGRAVQSVAEASFDAWIKFYRPDAQSPNATVSYYLKGCLIGLVLDLEIRFRTGGSSLDDVMRRLYLEYHQEKLRGFTEEEFRLVCEEVAGGNLGDIFDDYVSGTREIDFDRYLGYAGLKFSEQGNRAGEAARGHLGIAIKTADGRVFVNSVAAGGPAWEQGLNVQDEIIAVNGFRASQEFLTSYLQGKPPGTELQFLVSRDGCLRAMDVRLGEKHEKEFKIEPVSNPTAEQKRLFESWIFSPWETAVAAG